ncbi:MAG: Type 1 glutamine amidotransferase-like domain-containing protein [Acholeplasmataceae bacterium]
MTHILLSRGILGQPHIKKHVASLLNPKHRVAVVAFSFFPKDIPTKKLYDETYLKGGIYYQKMIDAFLPYGILESNITFLHYYQDDFVMLKAKIEKADILYFPGGAPDFMMQRLHEKGLVSEIVKQKDKIIIGSSAGAMIQFDHYHISPDHDYHKFEINQGLGLLSGFGVEVHYRRRKKQKASLRRVHRDSKIPIYAIPDDGALIIHHDQMTCVNAYQLYDKKGIVSLKGAYK